jgi:hypothetical protein
MPRGKERRIVYIVTLDAQGRRVVKAVPEPQATVRNCA